MKYERIEDPDRKFFFFHML